MRRLYPDATSDSPVDELYGDLVLDAGRTRAHVAIGMVASLDGSVTVGGVSGPLGGPADRVAFRRLRDAADAIVVGAGTVRAEDYRPPQGTPDRREARRRVGLTAVPTLVIVSGSLDLDPAMRVFSAPDHRPVVVTSRSAPARHRRRLDEVADVVAVGDRRVDLGSALTELADRGLRRVVCEGGPSLNGSLLEADLVDELFVTFAPVAVAGDGPRLARGDQPIDPRRFTLTAVHVHEDELLLRYRRRGETPSAD